MFDGEGCDVGIRGQIPCRAQGSDDSAENIPVPLLRRNNPHGRLIQPFVDHLDRLFRAQGVGHDALARGDAEKSQNHHPREGDRFGAGKGSGDFILHSEEADEILDKYKLRSISWEVFDAQGKSVEIDGDVVDQRGYEPRFNQAYIENDALVTVSHIAKKILASIKMLDSNKKIRELDFEPIEYEGESLDIGFNPQYLLDFIGACGAESISISLKDSETQGMLRPVGSEDLDYRYVVMPMKF